MEENYQNPQEKNTLEKSIEESPVLETTPKPYLDEDEIDLIDYLKVIWKRKIGVIIITIIAVLGTSLISLFVLPKIYQSSILIKIGEINGKNIEEISDIAIALKQESILSEIAKALNWDIENSKNKIDNLRNNIKLEKQPEEDLIKISAQSTSPEESYQIISTLNNILLSSHQEKLKQAEGLINTEIENLKEQKQKIEKNLEAAKQSLEQIKNDISFYEQEINKRTGTESEAQGLIAQSYINLLAEAKKQKEDKEFQILSLEQEKLNLDKTIQQKEYEKKYGMKMSEVVVSPEIPDKPFKPNVLLNTIIAGILGLFIGIFWAFGAEYVEKNKGRL